MLHSSQIELTNLKNMAAAVQVPSFWLFLANLLLYDESSCQQQPQERNVRFSVYR